MAIDVKKLTAGKKMKLTQKDFDEAMERYYNTIMIEDKKMEEAMNENKSNFVLDLQTVVNSARNEKNSQKGQVEGNMATFIDMYEPKPLPVVPQFVADWFEKFQDKKYLTRACKNVFLQKWTIENEPEEVLEWIELNFTDFIHAWLDGYTVEKEKKYCLKHIDMSKRDEKYDVFLFRTIDEDLGHVKRNKEKNDIDLSDLLLLFTQQEIDKMNVGSYEQIEVEE